MSMNKALQESGWSKTVRAILLGSAATLLTNAAITPALAQSDGVETVVVTAEKRAQDISKVPVTVQALGGDDLARQGIRDIKSALALVPGASLSGETSQGTQAYQLRGVAVGDTTGDATVATYLDDFAFSVPGVPYAAPADLFDLQRVEVLQGPQGTLYGSSSLGGVIKIVTNDPDLTRYDMKAAASFGSVKQHGYNYSADLMVNVPLIQDKLAVRAVLSGKHLSGYSFVPALGIRDGNNDDTVMGRVKVLWQPTERLSLSASYWNFTDQQDFTNRMDGFDPPLINDVGVGESPTRFSLYTGKINYDFNFASLTATSGYLTRFNGLKALGCQIDTCFDARIPANSHSFVQEVRLTSNDDGPLHWIGGLFYQAGKESRTTFFDLTSTINPNIFIDGYSALKSKEIAAFGEVSYDLWGGKVRPLVGLRWSRVKRQLAEDSTTTISGTPPVVIRTTAGESGKNFHLSPRFNLSFFPNDDGMLFVNVAQGYRPGALQTGANVASLQALTGVTTNVQLATDSLWSYEVGAKWSFFDKDLNVGLSLYKIDWSDAQFQTGLSGISGIINLGNVKGKGVDLQVSWRTPIKGLDLSFAGGWNSTKIYNINPLVTAGLPFLRNGVQVPSVPKNNATLMVNYITPTGYYDLNFLADARFEYRAKEADLATGLESGVLQIFSAEAGIQKDSYQVMLFVDNITDERGPSIWEQGRMIVPRPRTIGMRLTFSPQ
ncbi:MAG TPA: TonB-dependent receptor [Rhizomicrobium sp.]|nr:TonB-dependent receptor [Rhizomicrobium sp.]